MTLIYRITVTLCLLSMHALAKQIRYPRRIDFPTQSHPSAEYHPVYGGSPDQAISAESIGIEFEDSIIRSMLQIVDVKFNTLSTRMLSLERGINSLQVYLSRQFRHVTKNLQAVNIVMNSLHAEVSHVDMETRSVRNSIFALNKEFLDYRNRNIGVFRELPRESHRTGPVESVEESDKSSNGTQGKEKREPATEYNTSAEAIPLSPVSPSDMTDTLVNDSITMDNLQIYIEKGFSILNQTVAERFDEVNNITEQTNQNVVTLRDSVAEINSTLINTMANQDTMNEGVNYLKNMIDYLTERQDSIVMDISMLMDRTKSNNVLPRTSADQATLIADSPHCPKAIEKLSSVDLKSEFEKISDKLDMIDHRAEELNENLVYTSEYLEASRNHTAHVVTLVEALSGSTIWIPHILREVKMTARNLNESINATYLIYKQIIDRRSDVPPGDQLRPGMADSKSKGPSTQCKIDSEDSKLIRRQISKVDEILKAMDNSTDSKMDEKPKKPVRRDRITLHKKEVRGNSTSGVLSIMTLRGWLHVCYDEVQSSLVANIACTELGFALGSPLIVPNVLGSTEKVISIVCQRKEPNLDHCKQNILSTDHCKDQGLLGVFCVE